MKTKFVVKVENLAKKYTIQTKHGRYTLRDRFAELGHPKSKTEEFWALKDISFNLSPGEVFGVIGKNGSGKSTLLKILSRITEPTEGKIIMHGRVASLLEVGTGFSPELTGRENIYLNGAILGMSRREINRKFDEIVAFSEVEKFIDTPVKRYSSGMYVRLGFAVSAHLQPDILLVDEVLAVGDIEFQNKCMKKMNEVTSNEGRTIIFVSHNMISIKNLCKRCLLLSKGRKLIDGDTEKVIEMYLNNNQIGKHNHNGRIKSKCGRFTLDTPFWVNEQGQKINTYSFGDKYRLRFIINFHQSVPKLSFGIALVNNDNVTVFSSNSLDDQQFNWPNHHPRKMVIDTLINLPTIAPGKYQVIYGVKNENNQEVIYSRNNVSLVINQNEKIRVATAGILWHTSQWQLA